MINKFKKNCIRLILKLDRKKIINLSDYNFISLKYYLKFNHKLDIKNPVTFNEKLQWLKLYDRKDIYTDMVDKYKARDFISKIIGEDYLIPLIGCWDNFDDIDFQKLPSSFVLKTTHDSGGVVVCKNKKNFNFKSAKKKLVKSFNTNYYRIGREWPYKNVVPRIIAEKYLGENINDYKVMVFNGKARCSFVCSDRNSKEGLHVTFFDMNWNKLPFSRHYPSSNKNIKKPHNYDKMIEIAEKLGKDMKFLRVDFYEINKKLYVGELTLYPGNGLEEFNPDKYDEILGSWLDLQNDMNEK